MRDLRSRRSSSGGRRSTDYRPVSGGWFNVVRRYGHAYTLVVFALILAAGASLRTILIPFLFLEAGAIWLHVDYERETWNDWER